MGSLLVGAEIGFAVINFVQEKPTRVVCAAQDVEPDIARFFAGTIVIRFRGLDEFIDAFRKDLDADADDVHRAPISSDDDESNREVGMDIPDFGHMALFAERAEAEKRHAGQTSSKAREDLVDTISKGPGASGAINQKCTARILDAELGNIEATIDQAIDDTDEAIAGAGHEANGRAFGGFGEKIDIAFRMRMGRVEQDVEWFAVAAAAGNADGAEGGLHEEIATFAHLVGNGVAHPGMQDFRGATISQ